MIQRLARRLFDLPGFQREFRKLVVASVVEQFGTRITTAEGSALATSYLLTCASALAAGDRDCQDAALRVAHHVLTTPGTDSELRAGCAAVLDALTARAALQLATERNLLEPNALDALPLPIRFDIVRRSIQHSVLQRSDGVETCIRLNSFQTEALAAIESRAYVSISAPTSAGKTFLLLQLIEAHLSVSPAGTQTLLIVPTRALVQELEAKLAAVIRRSHSKSATTTSVPALPDDHDYQHTVFVLTQERAQILLARHAQSMTVTMVAVDEAQKIGDGYRGLVLHAVILDLRRRFPDAKVVFASPGTRNPEALLPRDVPADQTAAVRSELVTVNQNLLFAEQVPRQPREWSLALITGGESARMAQFTLPETPVPESKRLPFVAYALGATSGGNLVYANTAAEAEKTAQVLAGLFSDGAAVHPALSEAVALTKRIVHPQYALVATLERGVAFHYGNMPLLLRSEVERLFDDGIVKYLVCTSTLLEGVNLPARTIFMRAPRKGNGNPMRDADFWNLAGRAGRSGKEFQGNVVCVDASEWKVAAPRSRSPSEIRTAADAISSDRLSELEAYVNAGTPRTGPLRDDDLEQFLSFIIVEQSAGSIDASPALAHLPELTRRRLNAIADGALTRSGLPVDLIRRNPGVSPISQRALFDRFTSGPEPLAWFLPPIPGDYDLRPGFERVIRIINETIADEPPTRAFPRALLVAQWIRGWPLSRIIRDSWSYWSKKDKKKTLAQVIRASMEDIEQYARFKFPKYISCYCDVLRYAATETGARDVVDRIQDYSVVLEFGVFIKTQLSLLQLGLSRTSAIEISGYWADSDLGPDDCLSRLRSFDPITAGVPAAVAREIRDVLLRWREPA